MCSVQTIIPTLSLRPVPHTGVSKCGELIKTPVIYLPVRSRVFRKDGSDDSGDNEVRWGTNHQQPEAYLLELEAVLEPGS